jgi:hypothetical protein
VSELQANIEKGSNPVAVDLLFAFLRRVREGGEQEKRREQQRKRKECEK